MSLGLVAYDDSEESENEDDSQENLSRGIDKSTASGKTPSDSESSVDVENLPESNSITCISDDESEPIKDSEKLVNFMLPESKLTSFNTDIDIKCLTSSGKRNGPVKITIPSLNEVEEDVEPPSKKKLKPSQKGSGLFALLPNPKSSLVPQSVVNKSRQVVNKKPTKPTPVVPKSKKPVPLVPITGSLISYDDSGDEDDTSGSTDFFSLDSKEDEVTPPIVDIDVDLPEVSQSAAQVVPHDDSSDTALAFSASAKVSSWSTTPSSVPSSSSGQQSADHYTTSDFVSFSNNDLELDDEAMQQLCGRRDRLKREEVNIIDVKGDAIMPDSREWLVKQLTEESSYRASHKKKDGPTTQQKRKHQITYLAFQAKENELELRNQWANNRVSRKQTQAKYGF